MVVASGRTTAELLLTFRFVALVEDPNGGSGLLGRGSESEALDDVNSLLVRAFPGGRASTCEATAADCLLAVLLVFGGFSLMKL